MTVAAQKITQQFIASAGQTDFIFADIAYLRGEAEEVFDIYVDDVLQVGGYSITEDPGDPGVATTGTIVFDVGLNVNQVVDATRDTPREQPTVMPVNYSEESTEESDDRLSMQIQEVRSEVDDLIAGSSPTPSGATATILDWAGVTRYEADEVVIYPITGAYTGLYRATGTSVSTIWATGEDYTEGQFMIYNDVPTSEGVYQAQSAHTSGVFATDLADGKLLLISKDITSGGHTSSTFTTDLLAGYWELVPGNIGPEGEKGTTGDTGAAGADGSDGAQGDAGAAGADGIFSEIATQGESQTGTNNTKGMTPLRTKEAIAFQVPSLTVITDIQTKDSTQDDEITVLKNRVTALEGVLPVQKIFGFQNLLNDQAVAQEILGYSGGSGWGGPMEVTSLSHRVCTFEIQIYRQTDDSLRLTKVILLALWDAENALWSIERTRTEAQFGAPDGVIFSIATVAGVGQVSYVTDDMTGANYVAEVRYTKEPITLGTF